MSAIKLSTPSSGSISLSPANTASNLTITVPAVTGTMAIEGPAFRAASNANQTGISNATFTKVLFQTETFDTNNNFTNSTFTPTIAGYYQVNASVDIGSGTVGSAIIRLYKNGNSITYGNGFLGASVGEVYTSLSDVVYMNGTTDYLEIYGYVSSSSNFFYTGSSFSAAMVRAA